MGGDIVVHCASFIEQWEPPDAWDRINVQGTRVVLGAADVGTTPGFSLLPSRLPPLHSLRHLRRPVGKKAFKSQGDPNRGGRPTPAAFQLHPQSSQHALPLIPSIPSLVMIGTITSPATESAHHQPSTALRSKPPKRIADK
jgi:hypothetical protein